jgi:hypothetical protein
MNASVLRIRPYFYTKPRAIQVKNSRAAAAREYRIGFDPRRFAELVLE